MAGATNRKDAVWKCLLLLMPALLLLAVGCGKFFDPTSTTSSSSGTGSSSGGSSADAVYVANSSTSLETVSSYALSTTGTLSNLSGSPTTIGEIPISMAENPAGTLLWVGTESGSIYVYVTGSGGTIAIGNSGSPVGSIVASSMVVDPTGQWLLGMVDTGTQPLVYVYAINQSTGVLTATGNPLTLDTGTAFQLAFSPDGSRVFAALGIGGVDSLTFSPSTGTLGKLAVLLSPLSTDYADQGLTVDPTSTYLFVAETGTNGVRVLTINSDGTLTSVAGSPFATGLGPKAVLVDSTGSYVYVTNSVDGTVSGFSLGSGGALTALTGSPWATGTEPYSLAEDNTGGYLLVACVGGTPDLQTFAIAGSSGAVPGALSSASTASTGSVSPAGAIAVVATP